MEKKQRENTQGIELDALETKELERILFPRGTELDLDHEKLLFEHYKLLAQGTEQLAARRQAVNGFFLSLNSFMLAGLGFIFKESFDLYVHEHKVARLMVLALGLALIGFFVDLNWSALLRSYGRLLKNQLIVMEGLERHMVAAVITAQVSFHRKDFNSLSGLEKNIAHTFQMIYVICAIGALVLMLVHPMPLESVPVAPK